MEYFPKKKEYDDNKIFDMIYKRFENEKKSNISALLRKKINQQKDFFMDYSFDNININFSNNDIEYINSKNNIFSIHTADDLAVYLYINNSCNKIFGFKQDYFIGKCLYSFLHKEDVDQLSKTHDYVLSGKNMNTKFRLISNFKNNSGNKYVEIKAYIKKVDNIIITYISTLKKQNVNNESIKVICSKNISKPRKKIEIINI